MMSEIILRTGLNYFGKMMASISHEIKNRMAVINEKGGLMQDYMDIYNQTGKLDADRMEKLSVEVQEQISLMGCIVRNMNQLSHSVDSMWNSIDARTMLELFLAVSKRPAEIKGTKLNSDNFEKAGKINSSPFLLMNLIWLVLEVVLQKAGNDNVNLSCSNEAEYTSIVLKADKLSEENIDSYLTDEASDLAEFLKTEISLEADEHKIELRVPG